MKRSNTADCKSVGSAFGGSNPSPCTIKGYMGIYLTRPNQSDNPLEFDLAVHARFATAIPGVVDSIPGYQNTGFEHVYPLSSREVKHLGLDELPRGTCVEIEPIVLNGLMRVKESRPL